MKKIIYFTAALFYLTLNCFSQNIYSFQKSTATYSSVVGGTVVSGTTPWSPFTSHTVPIGFAFNYFGNNYTTIYCEGSGFCVFDPAFYYYTVHPYTVQMRDAGTAGPLSLSPISYSLSGISPNRICKIQWQNCELNYNLGSFANFQLWLYEGSNILEARVGNCTINNAALAFQNNGYDGPLIGIYKTTGSPHYGYCVQGASPTETLLTLNSGPITNIFQNSMSAPPPSGAVYRFIPGSASGISEISEDQKINFFPNPANNEISVINSEPGFWEINDARGTLIKKGEVNLKEDKINVMELEGGIYFLRVNNAYLKFIKE